MPNAYPYARLDIAVLKDIFFEKHIQKAKFKQKVWNRVFEILGHYHRLTCLIGFLVP